MSDPRPRILERGGDFETAPACPASREAVLEMEEQGHADCPLCGRAYDQHPSEEWDTTNRAGGHEHWDEG